MAFPIENCCGLIVKEVEDDIVSLGIKKLSVSIIFSVILWLISFCCVVSQYSQHGNFSENNFVLFIPMWMGSSLGIVSSLSTTCNVCGHRSLMTHEQRLYLRAQGMETDHLFMEYSSLPLLKRLLCWSFSVMFNFTLLLVTQILFYLWFVNSKIGLWSALIPAIVLISLCIAYLYVVNTTSIVSLFSISLLVVEMAIYTIKVNSTRLSHTSWTVATAPLMLFELITLLRLLELTIGSCMHRYRLQPYQNSCLFLHFVALLILIVAQCTVVAVEHDLAYNPFARRHLVALWTVSISLFVLTGLYVFYTESMRIATEKGFYLPQPLCRDREGWKAAPHSGYTHNVFLGRVELSKPVVMRAAQQYYTSLLAQTVSAANSGESSALLHDAMTMPSFKTPPLYPKRKGGSKYASVDDSSSDEGGDGDLERGERKSSSCRPSPTRPSAAAGEGKKSRREIELSQLKG